MECGTQCLRYYCSKHPGANCCSDEGLLLATRQKGFINQPLGFILYNVFDIYTTFFIFHYPKEKKREEKNKISRLPDHHLQRLSWLYERFCMQSFLIQYGITISNRLNAFLDSVVYTGNGQKTPFPIFYVLLTGKKKPTTSIPSYFSPSVYFQHLEGLNLCQWKCMHYYTCTLTPGDSVI